MFKLTDKLSALGRALLGFVVLILNMAALRVLLGPKDRRRPVLRLSILAGLVAGAGFFVVKSSQDQAAARTPVPGLVSGWEEVRKPIALFGFGSKDFGKQSRYSARRHSSGQGRQDFVDHGSFLTEKERYLTASFYRPGAEDAPRSPFFVDIVRRASQSGLSVSRSSQPDVMTTRFGPLEVADITLYMADKTRSCLAYRFEADAPDFRMAGFACGGEQPVDRITLACAVDRLDLISAGNDDDLARFFTSTEVRRGSGCGAKVAPGVRTSPWLDASAPIPPLRNSRAQTKVKP